MTDNREATMWSKAASGAGRNVASQERGGSRGSSALSGSVFTRGSFANAFVSFLVAALLAFQGLVVSGGSIAYATGEDGLTPDGARTEAKAWTAADWAGAPAGSLSAKANAGVDGAAVKAEQMTEGAFRALAQDTAATVPADVTLQVDLTAPDGQYFIEGDSLSLAAKSDTGEVILADTTQAIALYQVDASGQKTGTQVATAAVSDGTLKVTLTDGATKAAEATAQGVSASAVENASASVAEDATAVTEAGAGAAVTEAAAEAEPAVQDAAANAQSLPANATEIKMTGDFDAKLLASALGAADVEYAWTLLKGANGASLMQAKVSVPSMDGVVSSLKNAGAFKAETTNADAAKPAQDVAAQPSQSEGRGQDNGAQPAAAAQARQDEGATDEPTTPETTSASLETVWCDNNDPNRPSVEAVADNFQLYFKINPADGYKGTEGFVPLTNDALAQFGWTSQSKPIIDVDQTKVNSYVATASGLPTSILVTLSTEDGAEGEEGTTQVEAGVEWLIRDTLWDELGDDGKFNEGHEYYNYRRSDTSSTDTVQYLQLLTNVEFHVVGKVGGQDLTKVFTGDDAESFRFYATANGENAISGNESSLTLATLLKYADNAGLKWEGDDNGKDPQDEGYVNNVTGTLSGRLPAYNSDGYPIVYSVKYEDGGNQGTGDYYQAVYNNEAAPNHGSDNTATFPSGTMTLIRVGTTEFAATKQWLDNDPSSRPNEVEFTLWRYSSNDAGAYANASQVRLDTTGGTEFATITITPDDVDAAGTVKLGDILMTKYGELPKYDPDGYPYVYALREDTSIAGYETIFGEMTFDENGMEISRDDAAPSYRDASGKVSIPAHETWTRAKDAERFVYDGGTITNRKVETVTVPFTKTWIAAAFQDQLTNVEVTLKAQCRPAGTEGEWIDVDESGATVTLTGWYAEQMTQSGAGTFSKYSDEGDLLEYRWVEYSVKQGEKGTEQILSEQNDTFTLELTDALGKDATVSFTSEREPGTNNFTNTFDNKTNHYVEKLWKEKDENGELVEADPGDATVTVNLYRDQVLVESFTLDGEPGELNNIDLSIGDGETVSCTAQEIEGWLLEIKDLPEYSTKGEHYSYLVIEEDVPDWHSERTYDPEGYELTEGTTTQKYPLTTITNTHGPGVSTDIPVSKSWTDGSDNTHRLPSVVEVVTTHELEDDYGNQYEADTVVGYAVLTEEHGWYEELTVAGEWNWKTDFKLREVGLAEEQIGPAVDEGSVPSDIKYFQAFDSPDAAKEDSKDNASWADYGWEPESDDTYRPRIATDEHVYEVTYHILQGQGQLESLNVNNRRIGLVDVTVTKVWHDKADRSQRPTAYFELTETTGKATFKTDGEGQVSVQLPGGNTVALTDENNQPLVGTVTNENKTLRITVEKDGVKPSEIVTYAINGLPKYDGAGEVATYSLTETFGSGDAGHYASSQTEESGKFTPSERHFHDELNYEFENRLTGVKDVVFHKVWKDRYVHEGLNQRPDIHLTLYKLDNDTNKLDPVSGYIHYVWDPTKGKDGEYNYDCTIAGLQKYDAQGREIKYYATEAISAKYEDLGYGDVELSAPAGVGALDSYINVNDQSRWHGSALALTGDALSPTGSDWAVIEDGTFTNALSGSITVQGTKLWENVPVGFQIKDLPEITVYLQQRVAPIGEDKEWEDLRIVNATEASDPAAPAGDKEHAVEGAIAWTKLSGTSGLYSETSWSFEMTQKGQNDQTNINQESVLPRFTEDGDLYQYRTREAIWGLMGTDGGFTMDDYTDGTFNPSDPDTNPAAGIFRVSHGETGSFLLRNTYNAQERGEISVSKTFGTNNRAEGDPYPDVTFVLYRYYTTPDGQIAMHDGQVARGVAGSYTLSGEDIANLDKNTDGTVTFSHTFDNLEVYAPNGSAWQYFVVETGIDGYDATVDPAAPEDAKYAEGLDGAVSASMDLVEEEAVTDPEQGENQDQDQNQEQGQDQGQAQEPVVPNEGEENTAQALNDVVVGGATEGDTTEGGTEPEPQPEPQPQPQPQPEPTFDFTFTNGYDPDTSLDLTGSKIWHDYNNVFSNTRPEITLSLSRTSGSLTENLSDLGTESSADGPYVTWDKSSDAWTYTVHNLERWAPDGKAWTYTVTEKMADKTVYKIDKPTVSDTAPKEGDLTVDAFENSLNGTVSVDKKWVDGENQWFQRPQSVTVQLQAKYGDGAWGDALEVLNAAVSNGDLVSSGFELVTEQMISRDNKWSHTWTGLPVKVNDKDVQYRVVEVSVTKNGVTKPVLEEDELFAEEGALYGDESKVTFSYTTSQSTTSGTNSFKTTITNTLKSTELQVQKTWNDMNNEWATRPGTASSWNLTFYVQWALAPDADAEGAGDSGTDGAQDLEWNWLKRANDASKYVTYTMTNADDVVTLSSLPKYDADGETLVYRVIEQVPYGYEPEGDYVEVEPPFNNGDDKHMYVVVDGDSSNTNGVDQAFKNKLQITQLEGTKLWYDYGTGLTPDFVEKTEGEGGEEVVRPKLALHRTTDGSKNASPDNLVTNVPGDQPVWSDADENDSAWEFKYIYLPKYDKDGNEYTYFAKEVDGSVDGFYASYDAKKYFPDFGKEPEPEPEPEVKPNPDQNQGETNQGNGTGDATDDGTGDVTNNDDNASNGGTSNDEPVEAASATALTEGDLTEGDGTVEGGTVEGGATEDTDIPEAVDVQTNDPIVNVATRFTLDKIDDIGDTEDKPTLKNIELAVVDAKKETAYAIWKTDADGNASSWVAPQGVAVSDVWKDGFGASVTEEAIEAAGFVPMNDDADGKNAGYIVGLREDSYLIVESGTVPENLAVAKDVKLTIGADGSINNTKPSADPELDPFEDSFVTITVVDEMFRGYFEINKTLAPATQGGTGVGIEGVEFELYKVDADGSTGKKMTLLAEGITTDANGHWNSKEALPATYTFVDNVLPKQYTSLADGLPPGEYCLKEVKTPAGVELPVGDEALTYFEIVQEPYSTENPNKDYPQGDHKCVKTLNIENNAFAAKVVIPKFDAQTGDMIAGAQFQLEYWADAASVPENEDPTYVSDPLIESSEDGLVLSSLTKGAYRLTEISNDGYVVGDEDERFVATFVIADGDEKKEFTPANYETWGDIDFTVVQPGPAAGASDTFVGIPNDREATGENSGVELTKVDAAEQPTLLNDAVFELQMLVTEANEATGQKEEWHTVVEDLATGTAYVLTDANDDVASSQPGEPGILKVTNLRWGTYRFVETTPAPGYHAEGGELPYSESFTIDKPSAGNATIHELKDEKAIVNQANEFQLLKVNGSDEPLKGAEFTLTPVGESTFADGTADAKTFVTNADGVFATSADLIVGGTYELKETKAPSGYDRITGTLQFKVNEDGALSKVRADSSRYTVEGTVVKAVDPVHYTPPPQKTGGVKIAKVDGSSEPAYLNGAVFELQKKAGNGTWNTLLGGLETGMNYTLSNDNEAYDASVTGATGILQLTNLKEGTYRLVETTAAPGYHAAGGTMPSSAEFVIGTQASGTIVDLTGTPIVNEENAFTLQKVNDEGEALEGAEFSITPVGKSTFADGSTAAKTAVTNAAGQFVMDGQLVVGGTYKIAETKAPEGYQLIEGALTISVGADGTLSQVGTAVEGYTVSGTTVKAVDQPKPTEPDPDDPDPDNPPTPVEPVSFSLLKTDPEGTALAGAEFTLAPASPSTFADGSTDAMSFTTDEQGAFTLGAQLLPGGTYTLTETKAPEGYQLIEGALTFTVGEDGTLSPVGDAVSGYTVSGFTVTAVDQPKPTEPDPDDPNPDNPPPTTPKDPTTPTTPTKPSTPAKSTTTVKKTTPAKGTSVVAMAKTGDPLAMAALASGVSTMVAAALALAVLTVRKRRER